MTPARRVVAALKAARLLREALEANGNEYSGALVPNLTTITDILTIPDALLEEQLVRNPQLQPSADEAAFFEGLWRGPL